MVRVRLRVRVRVRVRVSRAGEVTARALLLARRLGKRRGGEACGSDHGGRATWFELGLGLEPT